MNLPEKQSLDAQRAILNVAKTDSFLEQRAGLSPELRHNRQIVAGVVSGIALELAQSKTGERQHPTLEVYELKVLGMLPDFVAAQDNLDILKAQGAPRSEKLNDLRTVTEFDHLVRGMVDDYSYLKFNDVVAFMNRLMLSLYEKEIAQKHVDEVSKILVGMRHEIAAEQIIGKIDGFDYRHPTVEEDIKGADIIITAKGRTIPIDIKASKDLEESKRAEAAEKGFRYDHILWSGVDWEDFKDGSFRISNEKAEEVAPFMKTAILQAA